MIRRFLALTLFFSASVLTQAQPPPCRPAFKQGQEFTARQGQTFLCVGEGAACRAPHPRVRGVRDSWAPLAVDLIEKGRTGRGAGRIPRHWAILKARRWLRQEDSGQRYAAVTSLGYDKTFVVAHDIGNMVAYAYAAIYPDKVERLVVMDAPIPGI